MARPSDPVLLRIESAQKFEREYWGDCLNTYDEESKQYTYARAMRIFTYGGFGFDAMGASVLDIGGGPVSMLLKTRNRGFSAVIDPLLRTVPGWVLDRYTCANIDILPFPAENLGNRDQYDEVWIYNVLQHVQDPELVARNARRYGKRVRIFEWVDVPAHDGHPHELSVADLTRWLGGGNDFSTGYIDEGGATGDYFAGVTA